MVPPEAPVGRVALLAVPADQVALPRSCSPVRLEAPRSFVPTAMVPNIPGLAGKDLNPGKTIEEIEKQEPEKR